MRRRTRDLLLILTGMAASETLGHWWLGTFGRDVLPLKVGDRWTVTPEFNLALMILWPVALAILAWMVWFRRAPQA
jgi:hypothetical protein